MHRRHEKDGDNMTEKQKTTEEKEEKTTEAPKKQRVAQSTVFIGGKPPMNYVLAVITSLSSSNAK